MSKKQEYPDAVDADKVGTYPETVYSGAGHVYDEVLEYRVWVHPDGGSDYYEPFATYAKAKAFSGKTAGAEDPLVLVMQHEHINEPMSGVLVHVVGDRMTEWQCDWLKGSKRTPGMIEAIIAKSKRKRKK